jgi:phosphate-selective porin OprO/OprP
MAAILFKMSIREITVQNLIKISAAALVLGFAQPALADQAETKGGLTVKTDDGRFEFKIGGRFHLDAYAFDGCQVGGVDCPDGTTLGGMFLRRGYLTNTGKLYGWKFKQEFDLAASNTNPQATWREAWVGTELLGGELIIGQFKPFRSMEELTSSNDILMMERPYSSASSLYGGGARQFQMGVGYKLPFSMGMWALSGYNLHAIGQAATDGMGVSTRVTFLPVESETTNLHLGLVYGVDNFGRTGTGLPATGGPAAATIAGRNGTNQVTSLTSTALGTTAPAESQTTYSGEAAASFGPGFVQAEYANSTLGQAAGVSDMDVTSYYVQGSFFLTGETKPYKKDRATFGSPKPIGENGAWELKARYDFIESPDKTGATGKPEVTQITAGVNWYANPNVRLMLDYSMGEQETTNTTSGAKTDTELNAIGLRTQLSF